MKTIFLDSVSGFLPGSSRPVIAKGGAESFVVKCPEIQFGYNTLANEWIAAELLESLGLSTPQHAIAVYRKAGTCPFCDPSLRDIPHFASKVLSPTRDIDGMSRFDRLKVVDRAQLLKMFVFDTWADSRDSRQIIYADVPESHLLRPYFVDNGHLFGGPFGRLNDYRSHLPLSSSEHLIGLDLTIFDSFIGVLQKEISAHLSNVLNTVPWAWCVDPPVWLEPVLRRRLAKLSQLVAERVHVMRSGLDSELFAAPRDGCNPGAGRLHR